MLESIVTSKARIKLLLKFFLNPHVRSYLRELSSEFGGSTNAVRVELNRLVNAKLLKIEKNGRNKYYSADTSHPLYPEMHSISRKMTGLDHIHSLLSSIGNLEAAYITGDYARGIDGGIIDLVLVGKLDKNRIHEIISKTEELINRKIRPLLLTRREFTRMNGKLQREKILLLWGDQAVIVPSEATPSPLRGGGRGEGGIPSPLRGEGGGEGYPTGRSDVERSIGGESNYYGYGEK